METREPRLPPDNGEKPDKHLYRQVIRGGFWFFLLRIGSRVLDLGRLFVLARLLQPRDFGLLGIALLTLGVLDTFTQTGFNAALIQKKGQMASYLNSAWTANIVRGVCLFIILFFVAPYGARFFDPAGTFQVKHIDDPEEFLQKLQEDPNVYVQGLRRQLASGTRQLIDGRQGSQAGSTLVLSALTDDLNDLLETASLRDEPPFDTLALSDGAQRRIAQYAQEGDRVRINRTVLEEAFSDDIKPILLDREQTTLVIRVLGLSILLGAFSNIGFIFFSKELQFDKLFVRQICGTVADISVAIVIAVVYRSVWALAWGRLAGEAVRAILSYVIHPYRPRLHADWSQIKELWQFGRWLLATGIFMFLLVRGNAILLAKLLGPTVLGFYQMAFKIADLPATEIINVISGVAFPAYSKLQEDTRRLGEAFLKVMRVTSFLAFPVAGFILIFAGDITRFLLGPEWHPVAGAMQLLALLGLIKTVFAQSGSLFIAIGKPKIPFQLLLLRTGMLVLIAYPLIKTYGINGACLSILIPAFLIKFRTVPIILKHLDLRAAAFFKAFTPALAAMAVMVAGGFLLKGALGRATAGPLGIAWLAGVVIFTAAIYLGMTWLINRDIFRELRAMWPPSTKD